MYTCDVFPNTPLSPHGNYLTHNIYIPSAVPAFPVTLISSIASPVPPMSSPTLTCIADLSAINVDVLVILSVNGPGFSRSVLASQSLTGSEVSFETTVPLANIDIGSGEGMYNCSSQMFIIELTLTSTFISSTGIMGSNTLNIAVQGKSVRGVVRFGRWGVV